MEISINKNDRKLLDSRGFIYFQKKKVLSIGGLTKLGSYLGKPRKINYLKCHKKYKFINILKKVKEKKNFFLVIFGIVITLLKLIHHVILFYYVKKFHL